MRRLRYAMVGGAEGSFIGPIHRMALRLDDLADLAAGCFSRDPRKNAASAELYRVDPARVYTDWRALLAAERGKIDFLVVCTTNETHYAIARAALEAGLDVFCEKPLSLTVREAEALGRLASRKGRILGIPFTYTGYPMVKLARDLVAKGALGKIDRVTLEYVQGSFRRKNASSKPWKTDPAIAGPSCVVADIGVHAFTMLEYVTQLRAESLLADISTFSTNSGLEDDASVLLRLEQGVKCTLVTSKIATGEENGVRLRVYGAKASLCWDQESPNYLHVKYADEPERIYKRKASYVTALSSASVASSRFPAGHHEGFVEALANIYDAFVKTVRTRKTGDFPDAVAGARSMRFVEAVLRSARNRSRWTKL